MTTLSGLVAILSDDGQSVVEVKDLGPDPVAVKPGRVLPLENVEPTIPAGYERGEPSYAIGADKVTRTWAVVKSDLPDLAPYQFFSMLEISGKKSSLDAFINALPPPSNIVARAKLDRSLVFRRDNDLVLAAQAALGLTDDQLDALWQQASQIV